MFFFVDRIPFSFVAKHIENEKRSQHVYLFYLNSARFYFIKKIYKRIWIGTNSLQINENRKLASPDASTIVFLNYIEHLFRFCSCDFNVNWLWISFEIHLSCFCLYIFIHK